MSFTVYFSKPLNVRKRTVRNISYRVFYAFDPRRTGILLIGGDKTGNKLFYKRFIPIADRLYSEHLKAIKEDVG